MDIGKVIAHHYHSLRLNNLNQIQLTQPRSQEAVGTDHWLRFRGTGHHPDQIRVADHEEGIQRTGPLSVNPWVFAVQILQIRHMFLIWPRLLLKGKYFNINRDKVNRMITSCISGIWRPASQSFNEPDSEFCNMQIVMLLAKT